jgi:hypothetical protein
MQNVRIFMVAIAALIGPSTSIFVLRVRSDHRLPRLATELPIHQRPYINEETHNPLRLWPLDRMGATGLEPVTPSVSYTGTTVENAAKQGILQGTDERLHSSLHKNQESAPSTTVQTLAAVFANLSDADRSVLLSLLAKSNGQPPSSATVTA